ncbi:MAG TPA: hypothetical protein VJ740_15510 [Hyphomicrobiaceae bacterium]|nr:hypothetical protein [Hyphomicrobiaceae bacterium]
MKMIMTLSAAAALLAVATIAARAETDLEEVAEAIAEAAGPQMVRIVKDRRETPEYFEHDASTLPFGSSEWWRQVEREQRSGRR